MALYKNGTYLTQNTSSVFDVDHKPGEVTPNHGIYRCTGCGHEIVSEAGRPFPPQNHHQHTNGTVIRWRLLVYSQAK